MSAPSVPLTIQSSGYSHGTCPKCNTRKNKLTTVPKQAVMQLFVAGFKGLMLLKSLERWPVLWGIYCLRKKNQNSN